MKEEKDVPRHVSMPHSGTKGWWGRACRFCPKLRATAIEPFQKGMSWFPFRLLFTSPCPETYIITFSLHPQTYLFLIFLYTNLKHGYAYFDFEYAFDKTIAME